MLHVRPSVSKRFLLIQAGAAERVQSAASAHKQVTGDRVVAARELAMQAQPALESLVAEVAELQQQQKALERGVLKAFGRTELIQQLATHVYQCAFASTSTIDIAGALWHSEPSELPQGFAIHGVVVLSSSRVCRMLDSMCCTQPALASDDDRISGSHGR